MNSKEQETRPVPAPRLRFPGFTRAWEEKKLGELGTFRGGGTPDKAVSDYWSGDIPWISSSDIDEDDIRSVLPTRFITEEAVKNSATKKVPARSVLFVSRVGVGKLAVSNEELCTSQDFINLRPKNDNEYFLAYYFKSRTSLLISLGQGMAIKGFTKNDLESITLPLPSLPEQIHIAAALSSLDAVIAAHQSKQDALREHKRGLMAGLFPSEGERVPRLRFPEFEGAGEWEEKKLGEISDIRTGPFGSVLHQEDYVNEGTPIVTVEHLGEFGLLGDNAPKVSDPDKNRLSSYKIRTGDILFSRVGSVDRCSIAQLENDGWLFSGRLLRLRIIDESEHTPEFLNQVLKIESNKSKIRNAAVGQTMASLNTEILKHIAFLFPSFLEQKRIAAALSSLDDLMAAQGDKIAALQTFKRGLMQGLFPAGVGND